MFGFKGKLLPFYLSGIANRLSSNCSFLLLASITPFNSLKGNYSPFTCGNFSGVSVRGIHIPSSDLTNQYKSIQAVVIKDRSPIGKFKQKPWAKGIVAVFISTDGLFNNVSILEAFYSEQRRKSEMFHAFT